jgi:uncharacterized protein YndB with AHSA1/START domain
MADIWFRGRRYLAPRDPRHPRFRRAARARLQGVDGSETSCALVGPNGFSITTYEMDFKPGGGWRFVMHGPDGRAYQNKQIYVEIVEPERLVYRHVADPQFQMTVTFADDGGKTKLTVRMVFESVVLRDKTVKAFGAVEGLKQTLGRLGEYVSEMKGSPG